MRPSSHFTRHKLQSTLHARRILHVTRRASHVARRTCATHLARASLAIIVSALHSSHHKRATKLFANTKTTRTGRTVMLLWHAALERAVVVPWRLLTHRAAPAHVVCTSTLHYKNHSVIMLLLPITVKGWVCTNPKNPKPINQNLWQCRMCVTRRRGTGEV